MKEWLAEYTVEMFTKRNDTLTREMRKLQASEAALLKKQSSQSDIKNAEAEIIPTTQRILDSYSRLSVPEKNSCNSSALHLLARLQRTSSFRRPPYVDSVRKILMKASFQQVFLTESPQG